MASEYSYIIKVPQDRIAVLIGKEGKIKKEIESATMTKITVDSAEGDVMINGQDPVKMFSSQEVIKAIGRGFNPDIAMLLLKADYVFEIVDITEFAKTKNDSKRLKGRVIGQEGKSRRVIEELTNSYICIYGKTVGIIGGVEKAPIARRAVESLLSGSPHSKVYRWLERCRKNIKRMEIEEERGI